MSFTPINREIVTSLYSTPLKREAEIPSSAFSLPSSPPLKRGEEDIEEDTFPASRKRSHEDMNTDHNTDVEASRPEFPVKPSEPQTAAPLPSTSAHTMLPPSGGKALSKTEQAMPPPPQSGQRPQALQTEPPHAPKPNTSHHVNDNNITSETTIPDDVSSEEDDPMTEEPDVKIVDFNWTDLEERYHKRMGELGATEQQIYAEFNDLCNFFGVWASTSHTHEVSRSYKRLKTQTTLVQCHEDELEKKRNHYIKVVEAFKSALSLLER
ncbi:hypothetical protein LTR15_007026 [Elasticomyces elasticus]|nr:hypothetical protein LTR15_007026 [Elasticomyces elasticus]